jgi:hypothetical protein
MVRWDGGSTAANPQPLVVRQQTSSYEDPIPPRREKVWYAPCVLTCRTEPVVAGRASHQTQASNAAAHTQTVAPLHGALLPRLACRVLHSQQN